MRDRSADTLDRICEGIRAALEHQRKRTSEEIHGYPTPIAGCDAQFNHLLEKRTGIAGELERLAKLGEARSDARRYAEALDAFLGSCAFLDEATRQALRRGLRSAPHPRAPSRSM